jgi:uncharacterized membrane protein
LAHQPHSGNDADFDELVRAVRDLSLRVQRLERRLDEELADTRSPEADLRQPSRAPIPISSGSRNSALEARIGSQWLNRIGVVAILFGVSYLLRYAFVSDWISPAARIWLGVGAGAGIIVGSEWFRARGYRVLSLSLKAIGIGVIYLSLWAGFELYQVLSGPQTFSGLVILTALAAALALREHAEVLAALALIGAFATPLLISIPFREGPLFLYIAILDCATVAIALLRNWWRSLALSLAGTVLLCSVWYFQHYSRAELPLTITAWTVFFGLFCAVIVLGHTRIPAGAPRVLTVLAVANAAAYFMGLFLLLDDVSHDALALAALSLSALYFALAWKAGRSVRFGSSTLVAAYGGLGISFVALAVALKLDVEWLSLGWFVVAAIAMAIGFWRNLPWLRWGALLLLCAAIVKAFVYDIWGLGLGYRTISFIALGVLLLVMSFAYQRYGFSLMTRIGKGPTSRLR